MFLRFITLDSLLVPAAARACGYARATACMYQRACSCRYITTNVQIYAPRGVVTSRMTSLEKGEVRRRGELSANSLCAVTDSQCLNRPLIPRSSLQLLRPSSTDPMGTSDPTPLQRVRRICTARCKNLDLSTRTLTSSFSSRVRFAFTSKIELIVRLLGLSGFQPLFCSWRPSTSSPFIHPLLLEGRGGSVMVHAQVRPRRLNEHIEARSS